MDEPLPLVLPATFQFYRLVFLYNIFIFLFSLIIRLASIWNAKARQWLAGRKNLWEELRQQNFENNSIVWVHTSSAGELEQAKPVVEALKKNYPSHKIIISFFSPSGYNVGKNYAPADYIFYLPVDTKQNAKRLVDLINPKLVIFVKYDFWYHTLHAVNTKEISLLLVSAVFKKEQAFFKWYGALYRKLLQFFSMIFVQDESSCQELKKHRLDNCIVSGDTRFDRVVEIEHSFSDIDGIKKFIGDSKVLVAGSTWPQDEYVIKEATTDLQNLKLIIAPHEITDQRIKQIQKEFPDSILYSQLKNRIAAKERFLIIDNVGMLSRLYYYATICYVGGGFIKGGIHNILEAAVYRKPVFFGPNYKRYREAEELIEKGGAFSAVNATALKNLVENFISNKEEYDKTARASLNYINQNKGATQTIINYIQEKRLLTN